MKRIITAFSLTAMLFALAAQAQTNPPAPGPENKKLEVFVGTWTGDGKAEATPFGKGGLTSGTMICTMYAGAYHLICDSDDTTPMGKIKSHAIYGYSNEKKQYFNFGIDSSGFGGPGTAKVQGSDWTFEGSYTMGGKTYWFRTLVKLVSPKELTFRSEYSEDAKTWKPMAEGKMAKK